MNKRYPLCVLLIAFALMSGCGEKREEAPGSPNRLTYGEVKRTIVEGVTTQAQVVQQFGSPNLVTRNSSNQEVWSYNRVAYQSEQGASGGGFIFFGGSKATSSSTSRSFDLIITFDKNDVVRTYKVISSQY